MAGINEFTKLMLHLEGADTSTTFTDDSGQSHTVTATSDAQIDTAQFKFGSSSCLFSGTGITAAGEDFIQSDSHADFNFSGTPFTIDWRIMYNLTTNLRTLFFTSVNPGFGLLHRFDTDSKLHWYLSSNDASHDIANAVAGTKATWNTGQWYHEAITWDGTNYRMFVDGTVDLTIANGTSLANNSHAIRIGALDATDYGVNGWIDEFRVQKGEAVWTANFVPPTEAYSGTAAVLTSGFYKSMMGVGL